MSYVENIIIGGGIAGLYQGYKLFKKNKKFIILEKSSPISKNEIHEIGRLYSIKKDENIIELGASVIHSNQKKIIELIKELKLEDDLEKIKNSKALYIYKNFKSDDVKKKWRELNNKLKENLNTFPINFTVQDACQSLFTKEEYDLYSICYGEWFEINLQNVHVYLNELEKQGQYIKFKNGIQQIVIKLRELLKDHILYQKEVKYIHTSYEFGKYNLFTTIGESNNTEEFICNKLFICTSISVAQNMIYIGKLKHVIKEYLSLGFKRSCYRLYVEFDRPLNIKESFIMGDFEGRWSLKISDNLWLISYTDGPLSDFLSKKNEKKLINNWIKDINKYFLSNDDKIDGKWINITSKNVKNLIGGYWNDAYTVLDKKFYAIVNDNFYGEQVRELLPRNLIITCLPDDLGENTSWMEGHLF
jgi:ribosomal protein S17E